MLPENLEKILTILIANYIGYNCNKGIYWYSFINEPQKETEIVQLTQQIINSGLVVKDILTMKRIPNGKIIIFNKDICNKIANNMFNTLYATFPKFPKLDHVIDIEEGRKKEIEILTNYIAHVNNPQVDIYLYKIEGSRSNMMFLHYKDKSYKKVIYGFSLTEDDILDVNKSLEKYDRKITGIKEQECLDPFYGVRYSINIGRATYID